MQKRSPSVHFIAAVLAVALGACGSDGGGTPPPDENVPPPPEAKIIIDFPAPHSYVEGINMPEITVRGRANANRPILSVTVNGIEAKTSDGFSTWQVSVPLEKGEGENEIAAVVNLEELNDAASTSATMHALPPVLAEPGMLVLDPQTGRIYAGDRIRDALYAWDPASPEVAKLVAGENRRASRPALDYPAYPAWDPFARRLLFLGGFALQAVDPESGTTTLIADNEGKGNGPDLPLSARLFMDPSDANAVYATSITPSSSYSSLLKIDLSTGNRIIVTEFGPQAPVVADINASAIDVEGNRIFLAPFPRAEIVVVDLTDMSRETVPLPAFANNLSGMTYAAAANDLLFTIDTAFKPALYRFDLDRLETTLVSGISLDGELKGAGPSFEGPSGVVLAPGAGKAFVSDTDWNTLFTVDLATGDRQVTIPRLGAGPAWAVPVGIAFGSDRDTLRVLDKTGRRIVTVPVRGGAREVFVAEETFGFFNDGPPVHMVRDEETAALYVMSGADEMRIVAENGAVTRPPTGPGNAFDTPYLPDFIADGDTGIAWFIVQGLGDAIDSIGRFDLATGAGGIVSGEEVGSGGLLTRARHMVRDAASGKLIVWNRDAVVVIDPVTGDREFRPLDGSLVISDMVPVPEERDLLVSGYYGIHRYGLDDGELSEWISPDAGNKLPGMNYSSSFVYDPDRKVIYLASEDFGIVSMIDVVSGDEVILAR
ncbi:MAG TPA: hypothetical protein VF254_11645 [Gammaproteobacteria bacterium]